MPSVGMGPESTTSVSPPGLDPARHLDGAQSASTSTSDEPSPELAGQGQSASKAPLAAVSNYCSSSPSTPAISRREYCTNESGSPTRIQSPLRHSVSYTESPELPTPSPNKTVFDIDPSKSSTNKGRMALTGDQKEKVARSGWFNTSGTVLKTSSEATPRRLQTPTKGATSNPQSATPTPTSPSRFNFFSTALKGLTSTPAPSARPVDDDDDLIKLNIEQTLHSMTSMTDRSTFSPAAFRNLQIIATGMLHKFQDAYTERTMEVRELRAEQAALVDEQSEQETKMLHLRMQLEGMAQKAAEQEEMMQALMAELAKEKQLRMEQSAPVSGGSSIYEDLDAEEDQKQKWRKSAATAHSDASFDTDEEGTEGASVFSTRSRSPTITTMASDIGPFDASVVSPSTALPPSKAASLSASAQGSRPAPAQMSTFQKLFKGLSTDSQEVDASEPVSCSNCEGQHVRVAWDTVSLLKYENKGLKERVGDLEVAVEFALDVVNGVGR